MEPTEIKVAVFGASGVGKTVLLAAFFRAQTQPAFAESHGYAIQAVNKAQGSELLGRFYALEHDAFPEGSTRFDDFGFDFYVRDLASPALRLHWYDYPGGWWESDPLDTDEQAQMQSGLEKLALSDVGLLLVDGEKHRDQGARYVSFLFEQFADECQRMVHEATERGGALRFPTEWIIALSKADLCAPDYTAEQFQRDVLEHSREQLRKLSLVVGREGAFGHRFMLLSSLCVGEDRQTDLSRSLGLHVLAPAMLRGTLHARARGAGPRGAKSTKEKLLQGLRAVVSSVDQLDDFLPPKFQFITKVLAELELQQSVEESLARLRAVREAAVREHAAFEAVVSSMTAVLLSDEGKRAYHENQPSAEKAG